MNVNYLVFDAATGKQLRRGGCPPDEVELIVVGDSEVIVEEPTEFSPDGWCYRDGEVVARIPVPLTLAELKVRKWTEIKEARDRCEVGGCPTVHGRAQTDEASQRKSAGAVLMATIAMSAGEPYSITWTMEDNSDVTLDAVGMIGLGVAIGQHVADCHTRGRELRALIDAATSEDDLAGIMWDASS
ncbi:MAG: DUF4376 domain-containing protein [Rhizorhabdus sp.]